MPFHRASAPPPLTASSSGESLGKPSNTEPNHPAKGESKHRSLSDSWFDRKTSGSRPSHNHSRTPSDSSAKSLSKPSTPTKNVYTHCGRHTDQYLFGGQSMTDLLRGVFTRKD